MDLYMLNLIYGKMPKTKLRTTRNDDMYTRDKFYNIYSLKLSPPLIEQYR